VVYPQILSCLAAAHSRRGVVWYQRERLLGEPKCFVGLEGQGVKRD